MDITPFRVDDTIDFEDYVAVRTALHVPDVGIKPVRERLRANAGVTRPGLTRREWLAREDGVAVGYVLVDLPQEANRHAAIAFVGVVPWRRRAGRGRALNRFVLDFAAGEGRTSVLGQAPSPVEGGAEVEPVGVAFAEAMGYARAQTGLCSRLDLHSVPEGAYDRLAEEAAAHAEGYEEVTWLEGPGHGLPDEYADDLAYLDYRLTADAPMGDMDLEPEPPNPELQHERSGQAERTGTLLVHAAARHKESGKLVAWSYVSIPPTDPTVALQGVTVVDPAHRGHRLGLLVKLALQRRAREIHPELRYVLTNNAEDNAPMLRVNTALGYRRHYWDVVLQRKI